MGLFLSLKYISELAPGRYEFRRRIPESAKAVLGQAEFKRVFSAASPSAIAREHARIMGEFNRLVASAKTGGVAGAKTPREAAEAHLRRAAELLSGVSGARDDDERREILADALIESGADAGLYRAVVLPDAPLPGHTLEDARKLYVKEKLNGGEGVDEQKAAARVERVFARVRKALGKRAETCTLEDLKREDARKVRDHMLASPKQGGGTLSAASVRRELNILSAIVSYGIKEFDLRGKVSNPFEGLEIRKSQGAAPESEADKRDPLPASVVAAMHGRLTDEPDLIWRLLVGTGCRLAEVVGLRVEDIVLADDLPFVRVAWHEERRLKTSASIRVVPLVGDALEAATDAVRLPRKVRWSLSVMRAHAAWMPPHRTS
ncbi:phage integrase family protein [Rhodobacter aestuarii]|uniref:Phage integrase family protein n=1 Tax=Rhodobacter aestuarii TaxID=453582 RepID=A0A1N7LCM9_9RHOB|nr:tyrosine-type recombinase/integrase [Rhodobacter aestuarii]PTV95324.1 phage integrase family protein [Rhodobacter aestuarii]SIS71578.1 Phage integrase family protein [Rhodobacter aestuarii]